MEAAFDPRPLYLRAVEQVEKLAAQVAPGQLDGPTPCTEFTVRGLLSHIVGGIHRVAYVGEGGRGLDLPAVAGQIADTEWGAAVGRARERVAAAWADDATLERVVEVPWGEVPGRMALGGYVMELVTHTWDLARAVAPGTVLDAELSGFALDLALRVLPDGERADVPFGPPQAVAADADPADRLAAWLGRSL